MIVIFYLSKIDRFGATGEIDKVIANVELEVIPSGRYVIDGVRYDTTSKPTFHITSTRTGHELKYVNIIVEKASETVGV